MNDAISPSAAIADLRKPIAAIEPEFIGFASAQAMMGQPRSRSPMIARIFWKRANCPIGFREIAP